MSADNEHDAPDEQQEDPAEIKPFRSCPAAILRRTDLRPADKLLYLYLCDRWRLNGKRPFQARQDTTMMETGLGRDPYYASVQRLTDLGLVESVRTGRSKMFRLFPISSDIRETRISDMRETRNSDGRYSRSSIVQHSSSTPSRERKDVPEKPAVSRRALQKQKKGKTTTAAEKKTVARSQKVCTPGSPLIPGGYNGIDATVDHDPALVAALESFDFAYTVPGPKRQKANRRNLDDLLGNLSDEMDNPEDFLCYVLHLLKRRRKPRAEKTRMVGAMIRNHCLPDGFDDMPHRYDVAVEAGKWPV